MTALAVALLLLQTPDAAEKIKGLVAKIDGKDAQASLDAISRLVELSAADPEPVLRVGRELPETLAFYRDTLLREVTTSRDAKIKWPAVRRITLEKTVGFAEFLKALNDASGEKTEWIRPLHGGVGKVQVDAKDAPLLKALADHGGPILSMPNPVLSCMDYLAGSPRAGASAYGNYVVFGGGVAVDRTAKAGEKPKVSAHTVFSICWTPDEPLLRAPALHSLDVRDDQGRPIAASWRTPTDNGHYYTDRVDRVDVLLGNIETVTLAAPESDAKSIAHLRGSFKVVLPGRSEAVEFRGPFRQGNVVHGKEFEAELLKWHPTAGFGVTIRVEPPDKSKWKRVAVEVRGVYKSGRYRRMPLMISEERQWPNWQMMDTFAEDPNDPKTLDQLEGIRVIVNFDPVERLIPFEFRNHPLR